MRTTQLVTSYIQTVLFLALATKCVAAWRRTHDKRSAHLALATSLYGLNSLLSAVTNSFINTQAGEVAPRWEQILSSIVLYSAILAFLTFLGDFVRFPAALKWLAVLSTLVNIGLAIAIRPQVKFVGDRLVISNKGYITYLLAYIAIAFGVLGFTFLFYGARLQRFARFRLMCIGSAFTLLFVIIGVLPLWIFQAPTREELRSLTNVLSYAALVTAPLLYVGFAPPKWIAQRYGPETPGEPAIQT